NQVERSESRPHIVRIGAGVGQRNRKLVMAVLYGQHQRIRARSSGETATPASSASRVRGTLHHRVHIGARRKKHTYGVEVTATHRKEERRESGVDCRIDVGSALDQRSNN